MTPDATRYQGISGATYREAVMALMDQEEISVVEAAKRIGVPFKGLYRCLNVDSVSQAKARPQRFPEQYLVCKMLAQDTRERIMRPHFWAERP